ncbi:hypothetical protein IMCC9480_2018 [Oxalobacteraceae bacterium IMCC9480]|nr:hypothetical protein IMCC9480_2018 [Oxalobacteraceae bacterium IMCC9480]
MSGRIVLLVHGRLSSGTVGRRCSRIRFPRRPARKVNFFFGPGQTDLPLHCPAVTGDNGPH